MSYSLRKTNISLAYLWGMRFILICSLWLSAITVCIAQPRASVGFATFLGETKPYVEVYITVERPSLNFIAGQPVAADFTLLIKQAEEVKVADKVRLIAPVDDTLKNFIHALRFPIDTGSYVLELEGEDVNLPGSTLKLKTPFEVSYNRQELLLSDIQLSEGLYEVDESRVGSVLEKNGYVLEPLPQNFIKRGQKGFTAYIEAYVPSENLNTTLVLEYSVSRLSDDLKEPEDLFRKTKKFTPVTRTTPFFVNINTEDLKSGKYFLRMVIRDRSLQEFGGKAVLFQVANPDKDRLLVAKPVVAFEESWVMNIANDSLDYVLRAVLPTVSNEQTEYISQILNNGEPKAIRLAIYNHFVNQSPNYPETAYNAYMKVVREVDFAFQSGFGRGFTTDRGYIFLKYGLPDDRINVYDDPSAPPYEIWIYNFVERTNQSPGRFLFYNPTMDNASYVLLHSTVRGEIIQPQWRRYLYSKSADEFGDEDTVQGEDIGDNVGRYADQYFEGF